MRNVAFAIRMENCVDYEREKTPKRFFMGNKVIEIEEVIDRWLGSEYSYVKVRSSENDIYILKYDELTHRWELTMFQSGQ